jgi:hypothetical protein
MEQSILKANIPTAYLAWDAKFPTNHFIEPASMVSTATNLRPALLSTA